VRINGVEYFYDIGRQKYVMFLELTQEIVKVEKEHIFKAYIAQYGMEEYRKNKKEILDRIELKYLVFNPHREKEWVSNNFTYRNTFLMSSCLRKAKLKRENSSLETLHNDLTFLKKYPHINLLLDNLFVLDDRKEYFINWLSSAFNTMKKNGTSIVLRGIPGAGKNVLYEQIIEYALGQNYCLTIGNDDLKTNFNVGLENKLFVLANEIKGDFRDGNSSYEKLKQYITDEEMRIEQKGVDSRKIINYFNMLIFSNNHTPLQIQGGDRRYTIYETNNIPLKKRIEVEFKTDTTNFIKGIKSEREDFIVDLLLYNYDLNRARSCQDTEEKERIYRASMTKIEILADKIKSNTQNFFNDILEILEYEDEEEILSFFRSNQIVIVNDSIRDTFNYIVDDINRDYKENIIKNNYLVFLYHYFVSKTDTGTKRGSNLTSFFGKSRNLGRDKTTGKQLRYRHIDTIKQYKIEQEASELF
jgi:hypothetical protein